MKINQSQICFWILLEAYKKDPEQWLHAGNFCQQERYIPTIGDVFVSYKGATRISDTVYAELPSSVIERKEYQGKSGAKYFIYRLKKPQDLFGWQLPEQYKVIHSIFENNRVKSSN